MGPLRPGMGPLRILSTPIIKTYTTPEPLIPVLVRRILIGPSGGTERTIQPRIIGVIVTSPPTGLTKGESISGLRSDSSPVATETDQEAAVVVQNV